MNRTSLVLLSSILFLVIGSLFLGCSKQAGNRASVDDYEVALLKRTAEGGDKTAQYNLGVLYLFGQGVEKNGDILNLVEIERVAPAVVRTTKTNK